MYKDFVSTATVIMLFGIVILLKMCTSPPDPVCKEFPSNENYQDNLSTCYIPNELIVNKNDFSTTEWNNLRDYLINKGFLNAASCDCSEGLLLFKHPDQDVDLIGVIEDAPKTGSGVGGGTGLSLNYIIEPEESTCLALIRDTLPSPPKDRLILPSVIVGLIDSGTEDQHTQLKSFSQNQPGPICNGSDQDFAAGWNIVKPGYPPKDRNGHGTQIAGILGGISNPVEIPSGDLNVQLLNARVTTGKTTGLNFFDAVCGMYYAMDKGARVINLSFVYYDTIAPDIMTQVLGKAIKEDILLVAGVGNNSTHFNPSNKEELPYPAALSQTGNGRKCMISVGAYNNNITSGNEPISGFSNTGDVVDIYAPGDSIITTGLPDLSGKTFAITRGTSMATGFVSRAAAKVISHDPKKSSEEVKNCIINSARTVKANLYLDSQAAVDCTPPLAEELTGIGAEFLSTHK